MECFIKTKLLIVVFILFCISLNLYAQTNESDQQAESDQIHLDTILDKEEFGWTSEKVRQDTRRWLKRAPSVLKEYDRHKISPTNYAFDSFLIPGRSQMKLGHYRKGIIFRASIITTLLYGFYELARSNDFYNSYETAETVEDMDNFYNEAEDSYLRSQISLGIGLGMWFYNVYDAYKGAQEYNIEVYNDIRLRRMTTSLKYDNKTNQFIVTGSFKF